jgi:hypothetical protein
MSKKNFKRKNWKRSGPRGGWSISRRNRAMAISPSGGACKRRRGAPGDHAAAISWLNLLIYDDGRPTVPGEQGIDVKHELRNEALMFGGAPPRLATRRFEQAAQERSGR